MHERCRLTAHGVRAVCLACLVLATGIAEGAESLRPPTKDTGPSGMSLPLPPPDKALASDGAAPPVPFGRARETLAPGASGFAGAYGAAPDDGYMNWSPPIPETRPDRSGAIRAGATSAPIFGEPMILDQFPRTLSEMNPQDYEAMAAHPGYDAWPMHERVAAYTRLFEQTRGRSPHFDRSVIAEARASAPPPQTIREANQDLYRPRTDASDLGEYGKMDSLRGSLRRDLFGGGR